MMRMFSSRKKPKSVSNRMNYSMDDSFRSCLLIAKCNSIHKDQKFGKGGRTITTETNISTKKKQNVHIKANEEVENVENVC